MEANFFRQLADLNLTGNLQMTIAKGLDNQYIISLLLQNNACGDEAKNLIPPLNLKGTAEELDGGFFEKVTTPLQTASGLMTDMEAYMKGLEEAKKKSAMEKGKSEKEKNQSDGKGDKYSEAMLKADKLDKDGKPRDAWMVLDKLQGFPEHAENIKKRKAELSAKFAPDLFADPVAPALQAEEEISDDHSEEFIPDDTDENEFLDEEDENDQMED